MAAQKYKKKGDNKVPQKKNSINSKKAKSDRAKAFSQESQIPKVIPADVLDDTNAVDEIVGAKNHSTSIEPTDKSAKVISKQLKKVRQDFNRKFTILCVACIAIVVVCVTVVIGSNVYSQNKDEAIDVSGSVPIESEEFKLSTSPEPTSTPSQSPSPSKSASVEPSESSSATVAPAVLRNENGTAVKLVAASQESENRDSSGWSFVQDALIKAGYPLQSVKEAYGVVEFGGMKQVVPFTKLGHKVSKPYIAGDILQFGNIGTVPIFSDWMGIYVGDGKVDISFGGKVSTFNLDEIPSAIGQPVIAWRLD